MGWTRKAQIRRECDWIYNNLKLLDNISFGLTLSLQFSIII
jgi:hypothetical protein